MTDIRAIADGDRSWVAGVLAEQWGSPQIVTRGRVHEAAALPGFIAVIDAVPCGVITYRIEDGECEVVSLNSLAEGRGAGTALLAAVREAARLAGCRRVWLVTTNDNLAAVRFYQKRGFRLAALYPGAIDCSRRLKPSIPETGIDGIPIRDEIELELPL